MSNLFIYFTVLYLISTFKFSLNKIDIKRKHIIGFNDIDSNNFYPFEKEHNNSNNFTNLDDANSTDDNPSNDSDKYSVAYISLEEENIYKVGKKGGILFHIDHYIGLYRVKDDTSRKTYFTSKIFEINNMQTYDVQCGLWIFPVVYVFCEFDESIPEGLYNITFENIKFFYFDFEINLHSPDIPIIKENYDMVDLYSGEQTVNLSIYKEEYEIKYYVKSYHNEQLYFFISNIFQANCNQKNNELICTIKRDILENQLEEQTHEGKLFFERNGKIEKCEFCPSVRFTWTIEEQTDIFVGVTNLLTRNIIGGGGSFVYETNVTNISNIDISFRFQPWNHLGAGCRFLKGGNKPMLLVCDLIFYHLGYTFKIELEEECIVKTFKYNLRIQPMKRKDNFTVVLYKSYNESYIMKVFPEVLDFRKKNSYQIDIIIRYYPWNLTGVTFNEAKQDLTCEDKVDFKRCIVPKEHFEGLKSDYYYIMRDYINKKKEIAYEVIPVKVILPEESNKNKLLIMLIAIAGAALIAIIIIIVVAVYVWRKKNTDLKEIVLITPF